MCVCQFSLSLSIVQQFSGLQTRRKHITDFCSQGYEFPLHCNYLLYLTYIYYSYKCMNGYQSSLKFIVSFFQQFSGS